MISEIIRLREAGLSRRAIARALNCSRNTVEKYLKSGPQSLANPAPAASQYRAPWSAKIDWDEVKRQANTEGVPISEIWEQLVQKVTPSIPYVSFWREFKRRFPNVPLEMHKIHPPGERVEIDYKGHEEGLGYYDRVSETWIPCRLFGAVMCFSQLFFAYVTHTERQNDLMTSIAKGYEYFGGVALTTAFDNSKAAVTKAHIYDPDLHPEFARFCEHFSTAPLAMRPRKPKDKNLVENSLGVFWRWARRKLKQHRYFSLEDLNRAILALVNDFNSRVQRKYGMSRMQKFVGGEKEMLLPLPVERWSYGEWKTPTVHPDCHVQINYNFYSVPYALRGKVLDARVTSAIVEIFYKNNCVARHLLLGGKVRGRYSTKKEHLPPAQQAILEATPQAVIETAHKVGPKTGQMIQQIIDSAPHPLRFLRRCQGIMRLKKDFSPQAIETASELLISMQQSTATYDDYRKILLNQDSSKGLAKKTVDRSSNVFVRGQATWSN